MPSTRDWQHKFLVAITSGSLALSLGLGVLLWKHASAEEVPAIHAESQADIERRALELLVLDAQGIYDSHPDADVGRVLAPNLKSRIGAGESSYLVQSNGLGVREREFELPKADGVLRVVLLGDSFVFATYVEAQQRFGAVLQKYLSMRSGYTGSIECLHLAVTSWNIRNECAFLRRQLSDLDPDLVVHVTVANDLNDAYGVRGFGATSNFSPAFPARASALVQDTYPMMALNMMVQNHLNDGLDHESRSRYAEALSDIRSLAEAIEARGAKYLLLANWGPELLPFSFFLAQHLPARNVVACRADSYLEEQFCLRPNNPHWNVAGHERIARLLYAVIAARGLLPTIELPAWPAADQALGDLQFPVQEAADGYARYRADLVRRFSFAPAIDFAELSEQEARQINGGISEGGWIHPYGSLCLANDRSRTLRLLAHCPDRPEMEGAKITLRADEFEVGCYDFVSGAKLELSVDLPLALAERDFLTISLSSTDYFYAGPERRDCHVLRLEAVGTQK